MTRIRLLVLLMAATALFGSGCIRKVSIAQELPVNSDVPAAELVQRIESYGDVHTVSAQANLLVRNYFTGVATKAEEFPEATGLIRLQRPENVRMRVSFYGAQVADMVSDGEKFRLAIFRPSDKRQFISGSNLGEYKRMGSETITGAADPRVTQAGGLINMRPQHVTEAFLIKPPSTTPAVETFVEQVRQDETEVVPGKKKRLVARTYYVMFVLSRSENGALELRRKYWFDRTRPGTPLVRQQIFDEASTLASSDIQYSDWFRTAELGRDWPGRVVVDRRRDGYRIELTMERDTVELNGSLPETTFVLENVEKLKEVNLDVPKRPGERAARTLLPAVMGN